MVSNAAGRPNKVKTEKGLPIGVCKTGVTGDPEKNYFS